ncbi:hypothetical protein CVD28_00840 [Bacillus sp. M6-12]|uniref:hypothetical protein n=1 Tax=Bacillus sp. M6-12 TaxID=2054166 RepID=UPI000C764658|nr:hypothetical protein [Bacillus sp. M6-12]PLS18980.1 hypothetical protein CVD28_00840 [Bacillus sp. M6-12]
MIRKTKEKTPNLAFERFGYATTNPCDVCGAEGNNQSEPRFGYVVCEEHFKLSPVEVSQRKTDRLSKEKKKENPLEEIREYFYEHINQKAEPRKGSWAKEELVGFIEEWVRLQLFLVLLLSRKQTDNSLNMFFILHTSKKAGEIMDSMKGNKNHEHYQVLLSLLMEEGYLFMNALYNAMKKSHEKNLYCFKDEIRMIEDYIEKEWSNYTNGYE